MKNGQLAKGGKTHPLTLNVYQPYSNWVDMGAALKDQWKTVLGLNVTVNNLPDTTFNQKEPTGDFSMETEFLAGGDGSIYNALEPFSSDTYVPLGKAAAANYGRFNNPDYNKIVKQMAAVNPTDTATMKQLAGKALDILAQQAPYIHVGGSASFVDINSTHWTGWPTSATAQYTPHTLAGPDTTLTLQHLRPAS